MWSQDRFAGLFSRLTSDPEERVTRKSDRWDEEKPLTHSNLLRDKQTPLMFQRSGQTRLSHIYDPHELSLLALIGKHGERLFRVVFPPPGSTPGHGVKLFRRDTRLDNLSVWTDLSDNDHPETPRMFKSFFSHSVFFFFFSSFSLHIKISSCRRTLLFPWHS